MCTTNSLHARFLQMLPRIETHANVHFRYVRCADKRADQVAETIALAWKWCLKLEERGKDATQFVSAIATFAARAVGSGRRVAGIETAKDVMNARAQRRHGYALEKLSDFSPKSGHALAEALKDNTVTPPPDAAAFRIDFPRWMNSLSDRDRRLAEELMVGTRTLETARRFEISPARVSQLRRDLSKGWEHFHGEGDAA